VGSSDIRRSGVNILITQAYFLIRGRQGRPLWGEKGGGERRGLQWEEEKRGGRRKEKEKHAASNA